MTTFERISRAHIASRGSKGTRDLYTVDLVRWLAFCQAQGVNPDEPTLGAAVQFRDDITDDYSPQSVRRILSALSSMYEAAGLLNVFKGKRLQRPPADEVALTKEFTEEEAEALLRAAANGDDDAHVRDTAILRILHETGMRISSVTTMRRERVTDRGDAVQAFVKTKKKGLVAVELPAASSEALRAWLARAPESAFVFPSPRNPKRAIPTNTLSKRIAGYGVEAGVASAHPHRFRATFITRALDAEVPINQVQAAVHHSNPSTTLRYDRGVRGAGVTATVAEFRKRKRDGGGE